MPRSATLTTLGVKSLTEPGTYGDKGRGNGLVLQVTRGRAGTVSKSWLVRYSLAGRRREMGLGRFPDVSLSQAREQAAQAKATAAAGQDPIAIRRQEQVAAQAAAAVQRHVDASGPRRAVAAQGAADVVRLASGETGAGRFASGELRTGPGEEGALAAPDLPPADPRSFRGCAEAYLAAHAPTWKNPKHRQQWANTLRTYAYPVIGELQVADVTLDHVLAIIEPIWTSKTETASRVRGRIEAVLNYGIVRGYRQPPNPAVWRGQLEVLLPAKAKVAPVRHHTALPYQELPDFVGRLRQREAVAARALELLILTAVRSAELRGMCWDEVDLTGAVWTIPPERTKMNAEHRVPLSRQALAILLDRTERREAGSTAKRTDGSNSLNDLVFPNQSGLGPYSDAVWRALFRRMGRPELTAHGFRSTFRDWCGEETDTPRELAEHALAHRVGNAVELAYRRGDALERRRRLMDAWGAYVEQGARGGASGL